MFGSTNLSSRSVKLDTELNFIMHTDSPQLRAQLQNEVKDLFKSSMPITAQTWAGDSHRIRLLARTLVRLGVKDML
jgi:CDP-diacylglycerol--glycerol-3-phosphate 3-phosphatidyltransferase